MLIQTVFTSILKELLSDFTKYQEMIKATLDLDKVICKPGIGFCTGGKTLNSAVCSIEMKKMMHFLIYE